MPELADGTAADANGVPPRVAVVGGGITGLAAAYALRRRGADVTVYEVAPRVGGVIVSERHDGYLVERGPSSIGMTPPVRALVDALGIGDAVLPAESAAGKRYVVRRGRAVALPSSPPGLVRTPILSARAKLRAMLEPFAASAPGGDESVAAFARRRFGREVAEALVAPLVAGIYAGDPERLSVRHALPALARLEREHGSLLRGMMRSRGANPGRRESATFRDGLAALPRALATALGTAVRRGTRVRALERAADGEWRVVSQRAGETSRDRFDRVVLAVPAHALAAIELPAPLGARLAPAAAVAHAPVATLSLGFRRADVPHPLDGFGILAAPREGLTVSGVLFASSLFAGRAPVGHVLLTCFTGGVLAPEVAALPTDAILPRVLADLRQLLGVRGTPTLVEHTPLPRAIPQYVLGHDAVEGAAAAVEAMTRGTLIMAGSWRDGVSVPDCLAGGERAAVRALEGAADGWHATCPATAFHVHPESSINDRRDPQRHDEVAVAG